MNKTIFSLLLLLCSVTLSAQSIKKIKNNTFTVTYSEIYQQPLEISYLVKCPTGGVSRKGLNFYECDSVITSDNDDYKDNVWDKGHLAPAADFNCNDLMLRSTFSYLNCALQHQGLNRGPWKELERFERNLAKLYAFVSVVVVVHFDNKPENWLPTGSLIPIGFTKIIWCDGEKFTFYFPNKDVAGQDWITFKTNK